MVSASLVPVLYTTYDRLAFTQRTLPALLASECGPVYVIDNASQDGTQAWLKQLDHPKLRLHFNPRNVGVGGAMNQFLKLVGPSSPVVGKVDNDTLVPADWVAKLLPALNMVSIVQARHPILKETFPGGFDAWMRQRKRRLSRDLYLSSTVGGSGILFRVAAVRESLPEQGWVLGGWHKWQVQHQEVRKAFSTAVTLELLDMEADGKPRYLDERYYTETGRLVPPQDLTFVTASHRPEVLAQHLAPSRIFRSRPLIVQQGYTNVPKAYNEAKPVNGLVVYLHHDVFLPDDFEAQLLRSLDTMSRLDPHWGVLGVAGVVATATGKLSYGHLLDRGVLWDGSHEKLPQEVDTLDELLLITHGDLTFDEAIGNHFYGADICMQAHLQGRMSYAIEAFCHHNSQLKCGERPPDFFPSQAYFAAKYPQRPLATTCTVIR